MKYSSILLIGGRLGFEVLNLLNSLTEVRAVLTNTESEAIINECHSLKIPVFNRNIHKTDQELRSWLNTTCPVADLIISVNYIYIIPQWLIDYPLKYAFNLHGSLLPKYRGRTPHVWAIINGEKVFGLSAHLITKGVDEGPIIHQERIPLEGDMTGGDALEKLSQVYPKVLKNVLEQLEQNGRLSYSPQDHSKATYFSKRSPSDGKINWEWHSERIRNWIRAQAHPYPGAFSFIDDAKLEIHWAELTDLGFSDRQTNGLVLHSDKNKLLVKCPDKVLKLTKINSCLDIATLQGKQLR